MSFWDLVKAKLAEPGTEPLTEAEKAALIEASRRHGAWEVFVEYHHNAMWAREDADRKQEANTYLAPEAVEYMQGEIKRRAGRESLLKAMDQAEEERANGNLKAGQAAERGDKPDAERDSADNRGAAGEGAQGTRGSGGVREGTSQTAPVEPDFTNGTTASDFKLARELPTPGRGHESQSAAYAAAASQDGAVDESAYGVGGEDQGTQSEGK